jgi:hypothetical protein
MLVQARSFWLPKAGNAEEEYEDAFSTENLNGRSPRRYRCAVADGATETSFSGLWARLLVEAYVDGRLGRRSWLPTLGRLRSVWQAEVGRKPLPWYAEEKVRLGAYAALLGVTVTAHADGSIGWSAAAIGDCCLIQLRAERVHRSFPLSRAEEFSSRPVLVGSVNLSRGDDDVRVIRRSGTARAGDRLVLMSDALACWFLRSHEEGGAPARDLEESTAGDFATWIGELRASGEMRNDDVTLIAVDLLCPAPARGGPAGNGAVIDSAAAGGGEDKGKREQTENQE